MQGGRIVLEQHVHRGRVPLRRSPHQRGLPALPFELRLEALDEPAAAKLEHAVGIRSHVLDAGLRAFQLRRGDKLQRARDLPRVADRPDATLDVLDGGHGYETRLASSFTSKLCWSFSISASSFSMISSMERSPDRAR